MDTKTIKDKININHSESARVSKTTTISLQQFQLNTPALFREYTTNPLSQWTYSAVRVLPPKFTS